KLRQLTFDLRRRVGSIEGRRMARTLARVAGAGGAAAAVCAVSVVVLGEAARKSLAGEVLVVGAALAVGTVGTYAAMKALRVEELQVVDDLLSGLRRRFFGRPG